MRRFDRRPPHLMGPRTLLSRVRKAVTADPDTGDHVPALGPADAPTPDGVPPGEEDLSEVE